MKLIHFYPLCKHLEQNMPLTTNLTHIVNHRGKLLCYNSATEEAYSGYFNEERQFHELHARISSFGAWSHAVDCGDFVLLYRAETGAARTLTIDEFGQATILQDFRLSRWTHLVATNRLLFCYNRELRSACVGSLTEAGQFAEISMFQAGELPFWTHVTGCDDFLLAYNKLDGTAATVEVALDGQVRTIFEYRFSGWDDIAAQGRRLYFRNKSLDVTTTGFLDAEGNFTQQITLPKGTVSDWTHVVPISRLNRTFTQVPSGRPIVFENEIPGGAALLFYDSATGNFMTSRLDNSGALLPLTQSYALSPLFSEAITPTYTYFRENVTLDQELLTTLELEGVLDKTVLIGATKIEINAGTKFLLRARRLVLVADSLFGFEGAEVGCLNPLDVGLQAGTQGVPGVAGHAEFVPGQGRDGGPGGQGGPGLDGWEGQSFFSMVKSFDLRGDVSFSAVGRPGSNGGAGGNGGPGGMGFLPHPRSGNDDEPVAGSAGGPGGPGGSGGSGGRGGVIKLLHCNGSPPRLDAKGGAGGLGGEGGTPGRNGLNGPLQSSPRGARGPNGSHGLDGTAEAVRVGTDLFDFAIRSLLPPDVLQKWADYRVRVGLHYYRSFVDTPETKDYLDRALREFNAALALVPADQQALQFRNMIVANLTVVGLPYDYEIKPDYETFSRAYYEWWDRIQQVRNAATNMVSRIESRNWDALGVARSIAFAEGQREVVKRLTDLAELKLKAAKDRVADATTKRNQILRRINQLETELSMGLYQDSQGRFLGSFFEVISKIAEFADPTAGAVAKIPTYVMPYWFAKDMTPEQRSAFLSDWKQGGKEAKELLEQYKQLAKDASEDGEAGDIIGGLVGVVEQSVKFVDKNVLTSDIRQSQVRDDIKRLAEEAARANFDLADRLLEKHQAELEVGVVEAQNTLWKKDLEIAEELREISENTIKQFTECAELLLRRAQGYFDNLNLLKFWSVRAFDIYTLRETPRWTDFSNGFPHPDVHENSFFLLRRGVGTEATKVLIQLEQVCNDLPTGDLVEELEFERYHSSLGSYEITKRITTPAMISRFRESLEVEFTISAEDLGELLDAIRVDNVQVVLLGATMAVRSTHCILTHLGRMTVRRTRTDVFEQSRRPHSAIVKTVAAMTELSFPEASKFEFFGRSPEAEWRLVLAAKPDDAVNLDGLTEIQIVLDCVGSAR